MIITPNDDTQANINLDLLTEYIRMQCARLTSVNTELHQAKLELLEESAQLQQRMIDAESEAAK